RTRCDRITCREWKDHGQGDGKFARSNFHRPPARRGFAYFHPQDYATALADCRQAAARKSGDPGIDIALKIEQIASCPDAEFPQQLVKQIEENLSQPEIGGRRSGGM